MKVILINGMAQSGKDTFISLCQKENSKTKIINISTVDLVKEAAIILGWDNIKDEKGRKFLSDLKSLALSYSDLSEKYIKDTLNNFQNNSMVAVFVHTREPEEIARLKEKFGAVTLLIKNNRVKDIVSNNSDKNCENYNYDYIIENNGSLLDLTIKAVEFMKKIKIL